MKLTSRKNRRMPWQNTETQLEDLTRTGTSDQGQTQKHVRDTRVILTIVPQHKLENLSVSYLPGICDRLSSYLTTESASLSVLIRSRMQNKPACKNKKTKRACSSQNQSFPWSNGGFSKGAEKEVYWARAEQRVSALLAFHVRISHKGSLQELSTSCFTSSEMTNSLIWETWCYKKGWDKDETPSASNGKTASHLCLYYCTSIKLYFEVWYSSVNFRGQPQHLQKEASPSSRHSPPLCLIWSNYVSALKANVIGK